MEGFFHCLQHLSLHLRPRPEKNTGDNGCTLAATQNSLGRGRENRQERRKCAETQWGIFFPPVVRL